MADTSLNENRLGILIWLTANLWQSKLRRKLREFNLSLNEYFILETIYKLENSNKEITQIQISNQSSIDNAVVSIKLNLLLSKKLIYKLSSHDKRSNNLGLSSLGKNIVKDTIRIVENEENMFFSKLNQETFNLKNSLKLLLGKKIRIKAKNYE